MNISYLLSYIILAIILYLFEFLIFGLWYKLFIKGGTVLDGNSSRKSSVGYFAFLKRMMKYYKCRFRNPKVSELEGKPETAYSMILIYAVFIPILFPSFILITDNLAVRCFFFFGGIFVLADKLFRDERTKIEVQVNRWVQFLYSPECLALFARGKEHGRSGNGIKIHSEQFVGRKESIDIASICRNKRFDCFSVDMAEATGQAFKGLQNADKRAFVSEFRSMIQAIDLSREDHLRKSIQGYRRLKEMAEDLRSEYQQAEKGIAEWNTKSLIAAADDAIHKLEGNLGFAEKAQQKEKDVPDIKAKVEEKVSAKSDAVQDEKVAEIANTTQEKNTVSIADTLQDNSSVSDADTEKKGRKISYSVDEIDSIRYYQGDTSRFKSDYRRRDKKKLYAIGNAYEVLNTLLYPGISNEEARITIEKRKLSAMLLDNMEDVLMTYEHMISAIFKSTGPEGITKAYRFDRENSLQFLKQGKTCSFMSTTQAADLEYFKRKCGLVLEEIIAEPGTPCLNLNQMLSESGKYSHEKEILFPPFVKLEMREIELSEIERTYRDKENKPPIGKWVIHIVGCEEIRDYDLSQTRLEKLQQQILDESETRNAKGIWKCLENNQKIEGEDKDRYIAWKEKIQEYVRILCFREWKQRGESL